MPPPVGEAVPYTDSITYTLQDTLGKTPYTLFYYAWNQSGMEDKLAADPKAGYTLLVPTNQAMEEAGWSLEALDAASGQVLQELVQSHVFSGKITPEVLCSISGSYKANSLYVYPRVYYSSELKPYVYSAQLQYTQDLLVNGKSLGTETPLETSNGYIWPVRQVLQVPQQSAWEVLKADERFSLYVQLLEYTDAAYRELFIQANGYAPEDGPAEVHIYARNSPLYYGLALSMEQAQAYVEQPNTWFIPSNQAFNAAGFYTLEDLMAFNTTHGEPEVEQVSGSPAYFRLVGDFATDSLLDYHDNWGMRMASYTLTRRRNATLFYSTDLSQQIFSDYPISALTEIEYGYYFPMMGETVFHYMPLVFQEGAVWVKGMPGDKVHFSDTDINTLNGVIHVVDGLLIPEKYK